MDTKRRTSAALAKTVLLLFALIMLAILLKGPLTSSVARVQGERVFENTIPKEVPIKIKIK